VEFELAQGSRHDSAPSLTPDGRVCSAAVRVESSLNCVTNWGNVAAYHVFSWTAARAKVPQGTLGMVILQIVAAGR
jgi:hypothetical protein